MASGICDTGRTRLSFADVRAACRLSPAQIGLGNVESTAIGFVQNGQIVEGFLTKGIKRDLCTQVPLKAVEGPC